MARTHLFDDYVVAITSDGTILDVWTGKRYKPYPLDQHVTQYRVSFADSAQDAIKRAHAIRELIARKNADERRRIKMGNYEASATLENGLRALGKFDDYDTMCQWLAENSTAGIAAYDIDAGEPVDQAQLQEDVRQYQP